MPDRGGAVHQLTLIPLEPLAVRLVRLGLDRKTRVATHRNRTVMVSLGARSGLRLHEGYGYAPDQVLVAILQFLQPRLTRAARQSAKRSFLAFPVEDYVPSRPRPSGRERARPGDIRVRYRLEQLHAELNGRYFDHGLGTVPFRLSGRMRSRLGELTVDLKTGRPVEITLSRRHLRRHSWEAVTETVLHEMVHQWQAETGLPLDHGVAFRRKARALGIDPRAKRRVDEC